MLTPYDAPSCTAAGLRAVSHTVSPLALLVALSALATARPAHAQRTNASPPRSRSVTIVAGAFGGNAAATDGLHPLVGARADRVVRPWLIGEVGVALASAVRPVIQRRTINLVGGGSVGPFTSTDMIKIPLAMPDVHLRAELLSGWFRPYVGAGGGLLIAFVGGDIGDRFVRPAAFGTAGLRLDIGRHVGVRGEVRLRVDSYPGARTVAGSEQTAGLSWRF